MTDADEVLLTMQDAVELIRRETGIPITRSRIRKILLTGSRQSQRQHTAAGISGAELKCSTMRGR